MGRSKTIWLTLGLLGLGGQVLRAQSVCGDSNAYSTHVMNFLITTATATDSSTIAMRIAAGIPAASSSEVRFVRDSAVCAQAGSAYAAAERDSVLSGGRQTQPGD